MSSNRVGINSEFIKLRVHTSNDRRRAKKKLHYKAIQSECQENSTVPFVIALGKVNNYLIFCLYTIQTHFDRGVGVLFAKYDIFSTLPLADIFSPRQNNLMSRGSNFLTKSLSSRRFTCIIKAV